MALLDLVLARLGPVVLLLVDLVEELFDAELLDVVGFAGVVDFLATGFFVVVLFEVVDFLLLLEVALARVLFVDRELRDFRLLRTDGFQPSARSARKDAGIRSTASPLSTTESAAASARSARTSAITLAGRRARAA